MLTPLKCPLTSRQLQILSELADGKDRKQIAFALGVSHPMITYEIRNAAELAKVSRSSSALVAKALRSGWID